MNLSKHAAFTDYLSFISKTLGITVCVKDTSGFMGLLDQDLAMELVDYLLHTNPYCVYMKSAPSVCLQCSRAAIPIAKKCRETNAPFFGRCHCGVSEYILPITHPRSGLLGYITAGSFHSQDAKAIELIRRKCKRTGLDAALAIEKYNSLPLPPHYDCKTIADALGLAANYLASQISAHEIKKTSSPRTANEDSILTRILALIHENYKTPLKVSHISEACGCSDSYIHHLFKSRTGVNFKAYINWKRIEKSKTMLKLSDASVTEIALSLGFGDANYFTKVFSSLTGMTPTEFRKQNSQ